MQGIFKCFCEASHGSNRLLLTTRTRCLFILSHRKASTQHVYVECSRRNRRCRLQRQCQYENECCFAVVVHVKNEMMECKECSVIAVIFADTSNDIGISMTQSIKGHNASSPIVFGWWLNCWQQRKREVYSESGSSPTWPKSTRFGNNWSNIRRSGPIVPPKDEILLNHIKNEEFRPNLFPRQKKSG